METQISIQNIPAISAIYFALLHCGYDFYAFEKDECLTTTIEGFRATEAGFDVSFFAKVRQPGCAVYPYWPRAAALETASFYLSDDSARFSDFDAYRDHLQSAGNLSDAERDENFWQWVGDFAAALPVVLRSDSFQTYLRWENQWIARQNLLWKNDLRHIRRILYACAKNYASPAQSVSVVLNPVKCAYSADYHTHGDRFIVCSGAFGKEGILHEYLHQVVHPLIEGSKDAVSRRDARYPGIDESYYLSHDEAGHRNALEEYLVRRLTARVLAEEFPPRLDAWMDQVLREPLAFPGKAP